MWQITKVQIQNIVSLRDVTLRFKQGVATLIFGKNEDNASQPCNGSGKSSIVEAISFALTGEQLRKVKSLEEIINDSADEAYVYMELHNDYDNSDFIIERTISRNAPQSIVCHKFDSNGMEIESDKTVQPTVLDYNRFILSEIGLTKDEIYNNFILCDNKYESFFDSSDRDKKEIINGFCNGEMVDKSIEEVNADISPIQSALQESEKNASAIMGSIIAIQQELAFADQKMADEKSAKEARIKNIDELIVNTRTSIEDVKANKSKAELRLSSLVEVRSDIERIEEQERSLEESFVALNEICKANELPMEQSYLTYSEVYSEQVETLNRKADSIKGSIAELTLRIEEAQNELGHKKALLQKAMDSISDLNEKDRAEMDELIKRINDIDKEMDSIEAIVKKNNLRKTNLEMLAHRNQTLLKGAVTCPNCKYEFFVDAEKTVEEVNVEIANIGREIMAIDNDNLISQQNLDSMDKEACEYTDKYDAVKFRMKVRQEQTEKERMGVVDAEIAVTNLKRKAIELENEFNLTNAELSKLAMKLERLRSTMFSNVLDMLSGRISCGKTFIENADSKIELYLGQLSQYQRDKANLVNSPETDLTSSLKSSLVKYNESLAVANGKSSELRNQLTTLEEQKSHFTQFKSHIARKKIDALSAIVNDFLEKIGSDIRLKLEGYTMTRTGKLRDKISVQVMRDGIDCGSFQKFSGGEKARLNLACILSLHSLTNANCADGKGLDFLVIDELLDKSDEVGMATYCDALNKLGQTSLLITQGAVAENYPHKLLIVKRQGVSSISNDYNE